MKVNFRKLSLIITGFAITAFVFASCGTTRGGTKSRDRERTHLDYQIKDDNAENATIYTVE